MGTDAAAAASSGFDAADRAYAFGLVLGLLALLALGLGTVWLDPSPRNDFAEDRLGSQLLLAGSDPYDPRAWPAALGTVGRTAITSAFVFPPYAVLFYLPFALLPLGPAWMLWTVAGPALAALAVGMLMRSLAMPAAGRFLIALTLLCSEGSLAALGRGQLGFFLTATLAAAVGWLARGRETRSGLATLVLAMKPQLFLLAGWSLVAQAVAGRRWRMLAVIGAGAAAAGASAILAPRPWREWSATIAPFAAAMPRLTASLDVSLAAFFGGSGHVVAALILITLVAVMVRISPRGGHPGWLALSMVAAPYAQTHDHVALVVPLAAAAGLAGRRSRARAIACAAGGAALLGPVAVLLSVAGGVPASDPYGGLVPLALFALVLAMGRQVRDESIQVRR